MAVKPERAVPFGMLAVLLLLALASLGIVYALWTRR
jgi:hypothetical protein